MGRISGRDSRRVLTGVVLAVLLCVWGAYQSYEAEVSYEQQYSDAYSVAVQVRRLSPALAVVPANTVLGYVTDVAVGSDVDSIMINTAEFVLAPRLIERAGSHEWVLGNFLRPADFASLGRSKGLRLDRDFGNGVVLFHKER